MATFIDEARNYRAQGASRKQLVSYIKLHGVDDDRARRLADKLDMELGIIEAPLPAPPRLGVRRSTRQRERAAAASAHNGPDRRSAPGRSPAPLPPPRRDLGDPNASPETIIDLRDSARYPLVAASDPAIALGRVQQFIDDGIPRREIQDYLQRSGVPATEAAYTAQTTPPTDNTEYHYTSVHRPRRRQNDGRITFAVLTLLIGAAVLLFGLFVLREEQAFSLRRGWVWISVVGFATAMYGVASIINSTTNR